MQRIIHSYLKDGKRVTLALFKLVFRARRVFSAVNKPVVPSFGARKQAHLASVSRPGGWSGLI